MRPNSGSRAYNAKLTDEDVRLMRALRRDGLSYGAITAKWDGLVCWGTVRDIVNYVTWRHVA